MEDLYIREILTSLRTLTHSHKFDHKREKVQRKEGQRKKKIRMISLDCFWATSLHTCEGTRSTIAAENTELQKSS